MFNIKRYSYVGVVLALFIIFGTVNLLAQTAMVTNNFVWYMPEWRLPPDNYQCTVAEIRSIVGDNTFMPSSGDGGDRSFVTSATWNYGTSSNDPWHSSALIEYDNVFPQIRNYWSSTTPYAYYPNHCLTLCAEVTCSNPVRLIESSNSSGTATVTNTLKSGDFPIQTILFDIFKYQAGSNPYNADTTPPIRTIAMYPAQGSDIDNICYGVPTCCDAPKEGYFNTQDPSCQDDPQYEISCCDACWQNGGNGSCGPKNTNVCQGLTTQSNCTSGVNGTFCSWQPSSCSEIAPSPCVGKDQATCTSAPYSGYCTWNGTQTFDKCSYNPDHNIQCIFNDTTHTCYTAPSGYDSFCHIVEDEYSNPVGCIWAEDDPETPNAIEDYCNQYNQNTCPNRICKKVYTPATGCTSAHTCAVGHCDSQFCIESNPQCTSITPSPCTGFTSSDNCNSTFCTWTNSTAQCGSLLNGAHSENNTCDDGVNSPCYGIQDKFPTYEACKAGLTTLHFCTPWDGSYEIDGEFGKSNGQFGFRTTIKTNYPGDGISVSSDLNIEHMIAFPGDTQIPMQVDVTNVHSVRSSPTLVGTSPVVTSAPYKMRYRLSKDATATINIIDPEMSSQWGQFKVHRHLVMGQPRDGEGFQGGAQNDTVVTNEDNWDGRDDKGRLLPYGNYMVSIYASSRDEWTGPTDQDLSRAVTRQLSLDPLKITDIAVTGLSKESTAYAKIDYMLTEAATVHLEIYTPGTVFGDLNICSKVNSTDCANAIYPSSGPVQLSGSNSTGLRVASYTEQKARRVTVNTKWDGMCWDETNCQTTISGSSSSTTATGYAYGAAMPDGDYVYLLWAEIPYGSSSGQPGGTFDPEDNIVKVNKVNWDGVKTYMIYNGILPINRGFPEITIDAVSYSTIGSSPIANGLDPFVISYSLSRDSYVDAGIYTIASSDTFTAGVCESSGTLSACAPYKVKTISENEVKEALTKNTYYWDGLDDTGRYVSAGNYMLRITAKDSLFPAKMVTRTIEFPVDMFRLVDVTTTPLLELGSSNTLSGLASISYMLSKSMDVSVKIYDRGVVIPKGGMDNSTPAQPCVWPPLEQDGVPGSYCMNNTECCIHETVYSTNPVSSIKEFKGTRQGEGYTITDYWDGYKVTNGLVTTEMVPDGLYPYIIIASASLPGSQYYSTDTAIVYPLNGIWHSTDTILASDRVSGYITVSRGPVYFTNIEIRPTHPTQYYSSANVELAPYEVQFSVNRISSVTIQIVSTVPGACMGSSSPVGTVCRTLTKTNFIGSSLQDYNVYDADILNTLYWDGKDENGDYVKTANYHVKFTAVPYLSDGITDPGLNETVEIRNLVVNNFQVFDRYIWDVAQQNKGQGKFAYQISVPMKTAIQIFKPGTRVLSGTNPATGHSGLEDGTLVNPIQGSNYVASTDTRDVLVKAIVGVRPNLVSLEEIWDGTDYAGQQVPDGIYPFRYVTVLNSYQMNSITGDPIVEDYATYSTNTAEVVKDWDKYINFGIINVVNGDSWYADIDWKDPKVTMFYPNPVVGANREGFFEITKVPAPGTVSIKIYNIAGDLVRDSGYDCVNAIGTTAKLEEINGVYGGVTPDWNIGGYSSPDDFPAATYDPNLIGSNALGRNFALRCKWDTKNNAGNKVARGLYYAIMTLKPTRGNAKNSQRVIKILIP